MTLKEAIERIKTRFDKWALDDKDLDAVRTLIPELAESEDEKFRKYILRACKETIEGSGQGLELSMETTKKLVDWLEKQKEPPFVKDVMLGYPGLYFYDGERLHFQGNPAMEEKHKESLHIPETCKENDDSFIDDVIARSKKNFEKALKETDDNCNRAIEGCVQQKEQKPVEWSEDERIRKRIRLCLDECVHSDIIRDYERDECFAYIEKQKDSDKAIAALEKIDKYIDEHTANAHEMKDSHPDKKYYSGVDDTLSNIAGILISTYSEGKQKEQQPAEWSKEEQDYYDAIIAKLEVTQDDAMLTDGQMSFLKSIPERFNIQPKQKWSEEDEKNFEAIRKAILCCNFGIDGVDGREIELIEWIKTRIESFRPQPHWKPSKLEIQAIRTAIYILTEERNFQQAGKHLKDILAHYEGSEPREDWKPSEEQLSILGKVFAGCELNTTERDSMVDLFYNLKQML